MDVLLTHFSADLGFSKKQVDTYVLIYLSYRYQNCSQPDALLSGKTFPLAIPLEGFLKFPVSLHSSLRDISPAARNHSSFPIV